jgi:4-hydroxybenzoate polyprenyltransferase
MPYLENPKSPDKLGNLKNESGGSERSGACIAPPLCVDLDGTLIHTDLLHENLVFMLITKPWLLFLLPLWLIKGRDRFKKEIALRVEFDPALLPYDERVLDRLREEHKRGRILVLATASVEAWAMAVSSYLGIFDDVIATSDGRNLKGNAKAIVLQDRYARFSYVGNDYSDLAVWRTAETAGIANAPPALARQLHDRHNIEIEIPRRGGGAGSLLIALRPYQWIKNLLVFIPIITANQLSNGHAWLAAFITLLAFCATASGIYILNDLSDLNADRAHQWKRNRPFASGMVPVSVGVTLAPLLLVVGFGLAWYGGVLAPALFYSLAAIAYTARLKELPLVDLFILAFLYVVRLLAGGIATGYVVSSWLLGFSAFLFLGLAIVKRVAEFSGVQERDGKPNRRGYSSEDFFLLEMMGVGSTFASATFLALYVQSPEIVVRYVSPKILWILVPLFLFWQMRMWLSTIRGYMHHDPILYSARDWVSWLVGATTIATLIAANSVVVGF